MAEYEGVVSTKLCLLSLSVPILVLGTCFATYLNGGQASALAVGCMVFAIAVAADAYTLWRGSPEACMVQLRRMDPFGIDASDHTQRALLCADAAARIIYRLRGSRDQDAAALEAFMTGVAAGLFGDGEPGHPFRVCMNGPSDWHASQIRLVCKIGMSHGMAIRRAINDRQSGPLCTT